MTQANQASRVSLIDAWARAWNGHDMRAAATLVASDVDFVTVAGLWLKGRDEFGRHHHDVHTRHLRATTWKTLASEVRPLGDDLALAHLEWEIVGELGAGDAPRPPRCGIFTWVMAIREGRWSILAAHNTNLRADTSHRLTGRGTPS